MASSRVGTSTRPRGRGRGSVAAGQAGDHRQAEGEGLAGPGLRPAEDVPAGAARRGWWRPGWGTGWRCPTRPARRPGRPAGRGRRSRRLRSPPVGQESVRSRGRRSGRADRSGRSASRALASAPAHGREAAAARVTAAPGARAARHARRRSGRTERGLRTGGCSRSAGPCGGLAGGADRRRPLGRPAGLRADGGVPLAGLTTSTARGVTTSGPVGGRPADLGRAVSLARLGGHGCSTHFFGWGGRAVLEAHRQRLNPSKQTGHSAALPTPQLVLPRDGKAAESGGEPGDWIR